MKPGELICLLALSTVSTQAFDFDDEEDVEQPSPSSTSAFAEDTHSITAELEYSLGGSYRPRGKLYLNHLNAIANGGRKSPISPVQELSVDNKEEEHFVTDTGMFNKHIHGDDDLLGNRSHETPRTAVPAIDDDTNGIDDDNGNEDDNDGDGDDGEKEDEGVFLNEAAMNTDSAEHQVDGMLTAEDVGLENEAQQEAEYDKDGNTN